MTIEQIELEAAMIAADQAALKKRSLLYQADLKEEAATALGLTWEEVNVSYDEWAAIRERFLALTTTEQST